MRESIARMTPAEIQTALAKEGERVIKNKGHNDDYYNALSYAYLTETNQDGFVKMAKENPEKLDKLADAYGRYL